MALSKLSLLRLITYLTLTTSLTLGSFPLSALAQQYIPPDRGLPGRREGGGTRGGCVRSQPSLTALMPTTNYGTTISEYPTFYWYVPQTAVQVAEFTLLDAEGNQVYQSTFQVTGHPGIVSLSLPRYASLPPLEVGKDYRWYFSLVCDAQDRSGDIFAEGWIQRVEADADLLQRLRVAPESDRPSLYAASGIWYDAVASLAELRRTQPHNINLRSRWRTLLNSVGLATFVDTPFAPCCDPSTTQP